MLVPPPNPNRTALHDAYLSAALFAAFAVVVAANLWCIISPNSPSIELARQVIAYALLFGVLVALALSARTFYRHRIHLGAWLLMFAINAFGMLLATQLFQWLHPVVSKAVDHASTAQARGMALNTLLLALALAAALLVRGAALLKNAQRMPAWMAARAANGSATPRLWLFALFWITPIAWWGLLLCALYYFKLDSDNAVLRAAAALCIALIVTRLAVRFVLFEKNKFSSWQRKRSGKELMLKRLNSLGLSLAALLTFYAYFYMTTRVQEDAFAAQLDIEREMLQTELNEFKTDPVPPSENAETLFRLARASVVAINWEWAEDNWHTLEAELEVKKNLTALSYFRQGAAKKAIDWGIDWSDRRQTHSWTQTNGSIELGRISMLEMRITAAKQDWVSAANQCAAIFSFLRLNEESKDLVPAVYFKRFEEQFSNALFLSTFTSGIIPSDSFLSSAQRTLSTFIKSRPNFLTRSYYREQLRNNMLWSRQLLPLGEEIDLHYIISSHPLISWKDWIDETADLPQIKIILARKPVEFPNIFTKGQYPKTDFYFTFKYSIVSLSKLRLLEAALGAKRYQRFYGHWPASLADCVPQFMPEIPPDPFVHGQVIHYESSPPRVYSAGLNGTYEPTSHGAPDDSRFKKLSAVRDDSSAPDIVLFLGN